MRKNPSPRRNRQPTFEQLEAKHLMAADPILANDAIIEHFLSGEVRGNSPQDNQRLDALTAQHLATQQRLNNGEQYQYTRQTAWNLRSQIPTNFSGRFAYHNGIGLAVTGTVGISSQTLPGVTLASGDNALEFTFRTSRTANQTLHVGFNLFSNQRLEIFMQEAGTLTIQAGTNAQKASKGYSQIQGNKLQPNTDYSLRLTVYRDTATVELLSNQSRLLRTEIPFYQLRSPTDMIIMAGTASILDISTYSIVPLTEIRKQFFSQVTDQTFKVLGERATPPAWLDVPTSAEILEAVRQQIGSGLTQADRQNAIGSALQREIAQWNSLETAIQLDHPQLLEFQREIDLLTEPLLQSALPYERGKIQLGPNDDGFIEAITTVESARPANFEMEFTEFRYGNLVQTIKQPIVISTDTTSASTRATMHPSAISQYRVVIKNEAGEVLRTAEYRPNLPVVQQDYLAWESGLLIAQPIQPQLRVIAIRNNAIVFHVASPYDQSDIVIPTPSSFSPGTWWGKTTISHIGGKPFQNALVSLEPIDGTQTIRLQNAQGETLAEVPITSRVLRDSRGTITGMTLSVPAEFWFSPEEQAASLASNLPASVNGELDIQNLLAREAAMQLIQSQVTQAHELVQSFPRHVGAAGKFNRDNLVEQSRFFMSLTRYHDMMARLNPDLFPVDQEAWIQARVRPGFSYAQVRRSLIDNQANARRGWAQDLANYLEDLGGILEQAELVLEQVRAGQLAITQAESTLADRIRSARFRIPQGITRPTAVELLQEVQRLSNSASFVQARSQLFFNVNNGYLTSHYSDPSLQLLYNRPRSNNSGGTQNNQTSPTDSESRRTARLNRLYELAKESGTDPRIRAMLDQLRTTGSTEVKTDQATYVVQQQALTQASSVPMVVREFNAKLEQAVLDEDAKKQGHTYGGSIEGKPIYYSLNNGVLEAESLEFGAKLDINRADIHTIFQFSDELRKQAAQQTRLMQIEQEKALKLLRLEEIRKERLGAFNYSVALGKTLDDLVKELHDADGLFRKIRVHLETASFFENFWSLFQKSRLKELNLLDVAIFQKDIVTDAFAFQQAGASPTLADLGERAFDLAMSAKSLPQLSDKVVELVALGVLDLTEGLTIIKRIDEIENLTYELNVEYTRLQKLDYEYFDLIRELE